MAFGVGELTFVLLAYLILEWRTLIISSFTIPSIIMFFSIFLIKESPKFVFAYDVNKAIEILNEIAEINKKYR